MEKITNVGCPMNTDTITKTILTPPVTIFTFSAFSLYICSEASAINKAYTPITTRKATMMCHPHKLTALSYCHNFIIKNSVCSAKSGNNHFKFNPISVFIKIK